MRTDRQAGYLARQAELLARTGAVAWLQLDATDLEVSAFPADLWAAIKPFSRLGVVDTALAPKSALRVWDSLFALPRGKRGPARFAEQAAEAGGGLPSF